MSTKVLFLCVHNSARSKMAEACLKKFGGERFEPKSAGLEPGQLNSYVVEGLKEDEIDISKNETKDVFNFFKEGTLFSYVVTTSEEISDQTRNVRDQIKEAVKNFIQGTEK